MKKKDVQINKFYSCKVSGRLTTVKIISESPYGGWYAVNTATGKEIRIRTAARLRFEWKETGGRI